MDGDLPELAGEAGAAFLLRVPATVSVTIEHREGIVLLSAGAPCLVVQLHSPVKPAALRDECWRVAQEALDIHAATHRQAYATRSGDSQFIAWQARPDGYALTIVDTAEARWQMQAQLIVVSPDPPPPSDPVKPIQHHRALRYYRLSQLSDDLFDAFRSAYLALEYLVSEVSPQGPGESETKWLTRVLTAPPFAATLPNGFDVPSFVESIYKLGRLPLFHAKSYREIYLPHGADRSNVEGDTFEKLQAILALIQHHRLDNRFAAGWGRMFQEASDTMARTAYLANQVAFRGCFQREVAGATFEVMDEPRYFGSIWGRTQWMKPPPIRALERIDLLNNGGDWISMHLPARVPLAGVSQIQIELRHVQGNTMAPARLHAFSPGLKSIQRVHARWMSALGTSICWPDSANTGSSR